MAAAAAAPTQERSDFAMVEGLEASEQWRDFTAAGRELQAAYLAFMGAAIRLWVAPVRVFSATVRGQ